MNLNISLRLQMYRRTHEQVFKKRRDMDDISKMTEKKINSTFHEWQKSTDIVDNINY